jgi:proline dehydrogenase
METSAAGRKLSSRFVAGQTLDQALAAARKIRGDGLYTTLDYLGESVTSLEEALACRNEYLRGLHALADAGLEPNVSLKLTQAGLDLDERVCLDNVAHVVESAAPIGGFVRVDMESSAYTERTLRLVYELHGRFGRVGAVIQSYLYRSQADVEELCRRRIRVRLCKGAYLEPASVAFPSKTDVDRNYRNLMKILLDRGEYPAFATHDETLIREGCAYSAERGIPREAFEFQMLYGVRRDLQRRLVEEGYRVRLYVPYGEAWYPYFMRRLAERPANVMFLARNLFR